MIRLYFHTSPNPMKVALFLEEAGLPYEVVGVDTRKGEQHEPAFLAINPNAKTPAIEDDHGAVFDSNAILLYLAEQQGKFLGRMEDRGQLLSWLMFVASGLGPFAGQAFHFKYVSPDTTYAANRYGREIVRHFEVLNKQLDGRPFIVGDDYTIVDMAAWGWVRLADAMMGPDALAAYPNLKRWFASVEARPAVARAKLVGADIPFKQEMDEEALRALFPQNFASVAA